MKARSIAFLALRNFSTAERGRRRWALKGAIAGIALALVPLVVVLEVADGMIQGITSRYVEIGTFHFQARPLRAVTPRELDAALAEVKRVPGVTEAIPVSSGLALAYSAESRTGVAVRALPSDLYAKDPAFRRYLSFSEGGYDLSTPRSALVSAQVAASLHVGIGDRVGLLTAKVFPGGRLILRPNQLVVKGVYSTGYSELDSLSVVVTEAEGASIFTDPGSRFIGIKVRDPYGDLLPLSTALRLALPPGWELASWYDLERPMYETFETTRSMLLFIMVLIVLVASVNISSSLVMLVIERSAEIAILKSTGASPGGITLAFVATGFVVGVVGSAIGMAAGLLVAVNINGVIAGIERLINEGIALWDLALSPFVSVTPVHVTLLSSQYYLETIPIRLRSSDLATIAFLSILLATAASWFPARRAGAVRPLEILRKY